MKKYSYSLSLNRKFLLKKTITKNKINMKIIKTPADIIEESIFSALKSL